VIQVVLADDQRVVRAGLRTILEAQDDMEIAGEAGDGFAAVALAHAVASDVVMMDIRMPVLDGIAATRRLTAENSQARVLLTTYGLDEYVYDALRAGAAGFLLKLTRRKAWWQRSALSPPVTRCWGSVPQTLVPDSPEPKGGGARSPHTPGLDGGTWEAPGGSA